MNNYSNIDDDDRCHGTRIDPYKDDVMMTTTMSDVTFSTTTGWNTMSCDASSIPTTILTTTTMMSPAATTTMDTTFEWSPDVPVSAAATQWYRHDDTPNDRQWPSPCLVSTATLALDDDDYEPLVNQLEAEPIRPQLLPIMLDDDDGDDAVLLAGLEEHTFSSSSLDDLLLMDQFLGMDDGNDDDDWL
jgi:hypothetical protein